MGGDNAPGSPVLGAVEAARLGNFEVVLVGDENRIKDELSRCGSGLPSVSIVHASETIEMHESPTEALRKKADSSINVLTRLLKNGEVDGIVSAGNTGAYTASCLLTVGRIGGVKRPSIGTFMPCEKGQVFLLDVGANPDCRPIHLYQFAVMGSIYVEYMQKKKSPTVGLLSIGEESGKGNDVTIEAHKMLKESSLNFVGNVEGRDILKGAVDVIVCDGFVGNIILKHAESMFGILFKKMKDYIGSNPIARIGMFLMLPTLRKFRNDYNYEKYGGAPLLGSNGAAVICHGDSSPKAIKNAIEKAYLMVERDINGH
ncbi:phosphate acyltransferase PlsX, partial [bacterium]|nr:phosphate acyltransferase PlsX [bacterium]